ncbi:homoserine O-acetyltransferase MetX [Paenibacillus hamazuiensis]|uniref:homoserine O-acetyltransferase MetX n=1 Tax=Paenibacillus hamazuiensis TaxID=2936508 RepID=UPI00200CC0A6|nr:homoserine O-acetyltransferase [Paenibacillus hamazuiensis]
MDTMTRFAALPGLTLESGKTLAAVQVAYETYGTLSPSKDNCVLVCHALTGDARAAGIGGWWDGFIGPGKALDTNHYFVVCSNVLGGCSGTTGPASVNNETGRRFALSFPVVTIRDMVRVQKMLLDELGIPGLAAVIGGSMGGMQALEWAILFPGMVRMCVLIATCHRLSPMGIAYNDIARQAIISDPGWQGGDYYGGAGPVEGLAIARMLGMVKYGTADMYNRKFGRALVRGGDELDFWAAYEVERYLRYQGEKLVGRFDANSYLYLLKAMDTHDICRGRGSLEEVLRQTEAFFVVAGISSDSFYPCAEHRELVLLLKREGKRAVFLELESPHGHDAFLIETEKLHGLLGEYLAPGIKAKAGLH